MDMVKVYMHLKFLTKTKVKACYLSSVKYTFEYLGDTCC